MDFNSVDIQIGDKTRKLVGTMQNLYDIEADIASLFSLTKKVIKDGSGLTIKEMTKIIYYGLNGNIENRLDIKSIEKEVFAKGYLNFLNPVREFLLCSLAGGEAQIKGASEPANQTENPTSSTGNPTTE